MTLLLVLVVLHIPELFAQWTKVASYPAPVKLRAASGAYSQLLDTFVLFGGLDDAGGLRDVLYTYSFSTKTWASFSTLSPRPGAREWATLTLMGENATSSTFVLIGGLGASATSWINYSAQDLWILTLTAGSPPVWQAVNSTGQSARGINLQQTAARRGKLYMFGGNQFLTNAQQDDYMSQNSFWELDVVTYTWKQIQDNSSSVASGTWPSARFGFGMAVYESPVSPSLDQLIVHSGRIDGSSEVADLWSYSFATQKWTLVNSKADFPGKVTLTNNNVMERAHQALYATSDGTLIEFGGVTKVTLNSYDSLNQVLLATITGNGVGQVACANQSAVWCSVDSDISPPARYDFAWAVKPTTGDLIVFGGRTFLGSSEIGLGDFWVMSKSELAQLPLIVAVQPTLATGSGSDMSRFIYLLIAFVVMGAVTFWFLARRRSSQQYFPAVIRRQQPAGAVGARPQVINQLPVKPYSEMQDIEAEHGTCAICFESYEATSEVRVLKCAHFFHPPCVDEWLSKNNNCPMCKAIVDEEAEAERFRNANSDPSVATVSGTPVRIGQLDGGELVPTPAPVPTPPPADPPVSVEMTPIPRQ
ncbi:hypothetical protein BASA81_001836 [Batrachochytrium salamandrivorans]|nr:hypothetical protein BASA81_001836 [Batrachochytrium salamandrivorans]